MPNFANTSTRSFKKISSFTIKIPQVSLRNVSRTDWRYPFRRQTSDISSESFDCKREVGCPTSRAQEKLTAEIAMYGAKWILLISSLYCPSPVPVSSTSPKTMNNDSTGGTLHAHASVCITRIYIYCIIAQLKHLLFDDKKHIHKSQMKNQSGDIPHHLRSAWSSASEELRTASIELHLARARHHSAILARIALKDSVDQPHDLPEWTTLAQEFEEAREQLYQAHIRYNHAVVERTKLSHALHSWHHI